MTLVRLQQAAGPAPLAVVMITLNEAHNMGPVLENLAGFAQEVWVVDSYSADDTVGIALQGGARVVQRRFRGFGDQWNFAVNDLPIESPWTMKLDPDERLSEALKKSIRDFTETGTHAGAEVRRRLWFMGGPLPVRQWLLRVWRTGACRFSDVIVNEHPSVSGPVTRVDGDLEHHDSPNLHHWIDKQNAYSTAEALSAWRGDAVSARPKLFGSALERRMWVKVFAREVPFGPHLLFFYFLIIQGAWKAGSRGLIWSMLRRDNYRWAIYKRREMVRRGRPFDAPPARTGTPDPRVRHYD